MPLGCASWFNGEGGISEWLASDSLGGTGAYNCEPARVLTTAGTSEGLSVDINLFDKCQYVFA